MLHDMDTLSDDDTGEGRVYASRLRPRMVSDLDAMLDATGETASAFIRRLVALHLDAYAKAA